MALAFCMGFFKFRYFATVTKISKKLPICYVISKQGGRFLHILWLSHNIWTLRRELFNAPFPLRGSDVLAVFWRVVKVTFVSCWNAFFCKTDKTSHKSTYLFMYAIRMNAVFANFSGPSSWTGITPKPCKSRKVKWGVQHIANTRTMTINIFITWNIYIFCFCNP